MTQTSANPFASLDATLQDKLRAAQETLRGLGRVVVAFSGGADSTLLLALAVRVLGADNVLAVTAVGALLPKRELDEAQAVARLIGAPRELIVTAEMADPRFAANPPDRCYFCKSELFGRLKELAARRGYDALLIGSNADDTGDFRPGMRAAKELGAREPLLEAGLTKANVRAASKALGLPTWDKPAMACLASRVPYGQAITPEKLGRIERGEDLLRDMGFRQCRLRDHGAVARIEVPEAQIADVVARRGELTAAMKKLGYTYVTVDLQGFRSGSMNETL